MASKLQIIEVQVVPKRQTLKRGKRPFWPGGAHSLSFINQFFFFNSKLLLYFNDFCQVQTILNSHEAEVLPQKIHE